MRDAVSRDSVVGDRVRSSRGEIFLRRERGALNLAGGPCWGKGARSPLPTARSLCFPGSIHCGLWALGLLWGGPISLRFKGASAELLVGREREGPRAAS